MAFPAILLVVFLVSVLTSLAVAARLTTITVSGRLPERSRQLSASGIPRIGGVAVFAALAIAILAAAAAKALLSGAIAGLPDLADAVILSAAILFAVGLLDDVRGVKPIAKLTAQTAVALIIYWAGFSVEHISLMPGYTMHLGVFALPVTILWLVGVSNAFNLIDGMDGLAGGVAIIGLITVAAAGLLLGNPTVPIYAVGLVGALLGFLRYNWPSARLFMGDSGSLVVGFLLAVLSVKAATDSTKLTYGLVPIFALAYPLFDTAVAMLRRWLRGVPLSRADRRHIHHQLRSLGMGPTKSLLVIYASTSVVAGLGLLAAFAPPEVTFITTILGVAILIALVAMSISWLQYHEFSEVGSSIAHAARKAPSVIRDKINARDIANVIRQAHTIEEVQAVLEDSAPTFRFAYMKLSTPETRSRMPGPITQELQALKLWKLEYPIVYGNPEHYDGLCLTIWCDLGVSQRPAGAERVAQIIGPAIAEWVSNRPFKPAEISHGDRLLHATHNSDHEPHRDRDEERQLLMSVKWDARRRAHAERANGSARPADEERASQL